MTVISVCKDVSEEVLLILLLCFADRITTTIYSYMNMIYTGNAVHNDSMDRILDLAMASH